MACSVPCPIDTENDAVLGDTPRPSRLLDGRTPPPPPPSGVVDMLGWNVHSASSIRALISSNFSTSLWSDASASHTLRREASPAEVRRPPPTKLCTECIVTGGMGGTVSAAAAAAPSSPAAASAAARGGVAPAVEVAGERVAEFRMCGWKVHSRMAMRRAISSRSVRISGSDSACAYRRSHTAARAASAGLGGAVPSAAAPAAGCAAASAASTRSAASAMRRLRSEITGLNEYACSPARSASSMAAARAASNSRASPYSRSHTDPPAPPPYITCMGWPSVGVVPLASALAPPSSTRRVVIVMMRLLASMAGLKVYAPPTAAACSARLVASRAWMASASAYSRAPASTDVVEPTPPPPPPPPPPATLLRVDADWERRADTMRSDAGSSRGRKVWFAICRAALLLRASTRRASASRPRASSRSCAASPGVSATTLPLRRGFTTGAKVHAASSASVRRRASSAADTGGSSRREGRDDDRERGLRAGAKGATRRSSASDAALRRISMSAACAYRRDAASAPTPASLALEPVAVRLAAASARARAVISGVKVQAPSSTAARSTARARLAASAAALAYSRSLRRRASSAGAAPAVEPGDAPFPSVMLDGDRRPPAPPPVLPTPATSYVMRLPMAAAFCVMSGEKVQSAMRAATREALRSRISCASAYSRLTRPSRSVLDSGRLPTTRPSASARARSMDASAAADLEERRIGCRDAWPVPNMGAVERPPANPRDGDSATLGAVMSSAAASMVGATVVADSVAAAGSAAATPAASPASPVCARRPSEVATAATSTAVASSDMERLVMSTQPRL